MRLVLKRVYEKPVRSDGRRILVDRLWPRGLTKAKAQADLWLKDIAPSTELRQWFQHDPSKWSEFRKRYRAELRRNPDPVAILKKQISRGKVTILYGAKDEEHNEALIIKEYLEEKNS